MKKLFLPLILALTLILSSCGGGGKAVESSGDSGKGEESAIVDGAKDAPAIVTEESSEENQPEPEPEPEPVIPYAEANGLSFSKEKGYTIPAVTYLTDENGEPTSYDGLSITGVVDASYTLGDISVSEADANGMVQMTIPYRVDFATTITADASVFDGGFNYGWRCRDVYLFDYYTGKVIKDVESEGSVDITYQDVAYPVTYVLSQTENSDYTDWVNVGGDIYESKMTFSVDFTYKINMPKEYDGLCLILYLPGQTEATGASEKQESSENDILLDKIDNINDYVLIRVSNLV